MKPANLTDVSTVIDAITPDFPYLWRVSNRGHGFYEFFNDLTDAQACAFKLAIVNGGDSLIEKCHAIGSGVLIVTDKANFVAFTVSVNIRTVNCPY